MGRSKVVMRKIENKGRRHITFTKRKSGLLKKAYELSTMSDVEVALIIFSSSGKLFLYESKNRVEDVLTKFLNHPLGRGVHNREHILDLVFQMKEELRVHQQARMRGGNEENIDAQIEDAKNQIEVVTAKMKEDEEGLEIYMKDVSDMKTMAELQSYETTLLDTLKKVQNQKRFLEFKNETLVNLERQVQYANRSHYMLSMGSSSSHLMNWTPWMGSSTMIGNTINTNDTHPSRYRQEMGHHPIDLLGNEVHSFGSYLQNNMSFPSLERIMPSQVAVNGHLYFPQRDYSGGIAFRNPTNLDHNTWNLSQHIGSSIHDNFLVDPTVPLRVGQEELRNSTSFVDQYEANQYISKQLCHQQLLPINVNIEQQRMATPLPPPNYATGAPQAFYGGHIWTNRTQPITHAIGVQDFIANQAARFQPSELLLPPTYSEGCSFMQTYPTGFGTENLSGSNHVENGSTSKDAEVKGKEILRD